MSPIPRALLALVRFALSKDVLKTRPDAEARSNLFQRGRHFEGVRPALQLAWSRKKGKRQGIADADAADLHDGVWIDGHPKRACSG